MGDRFVKCGVVLRATASATSPKRGSTAARYATSWILCTIEAGWPEHASRIQCQHGPRSGVRANRITAPHRQGGWVVVVSVRVRGVGWVALWCGGGGGGGSDDKWKRGCLSRLVPTCRKLDGRTPGSKLPASPPPLPRPSGGCQPWPCSSVHGPTSTT